MNVPLEVVIPVATALVGAIGIMWRQQITRSGACDTRVAKLEARIDEIQDKRLGEMGPILRALNDSADATTELAKELREHRDWTGRAIADARDAVVSAVRAPR